MRSILFVFLLLATLNCYGQESAGVKPGISINGYPCLIQNLIYSCVPRTCDSIVIEAGDSIEFCTFQAIELNVDTAYWLSWHFYGATNLTDTILHAYSAQTPLCHAPRWDTAGTFIVEVFYSGDLSAYPASDCYQQGPSHWFVKVVVLPDPDGVEESEEGKMSIAPNPTTGYFTLLNAADARQVTITDLSGKVLLETSDVEIDLAVYGPGIYFATILSEESIVTIPVITLVW